MNEMLKRVLAKASKATNGGNLTWERLHDDAYRTQIGNGLLRVTRDIDFAADDRPESAARGDAYSFAVSSLDDGPFEDGCLRPGDTDYELLADLFRSARRAANRGDNTLQQMDSLLGSLIPG